MSSGASAKRPADAKCAKAWFFGAQMSELKLRPPWNYLGDGFSVLRAWEWRGRSRNVRACVGGSVRVLRGSCGRSGRPCDLGSCSGGERAVPKHPRGGGGGGGGPTHCPSGVLATR